MAQIRIFGYSGIVQLDQRLLKYANSDSIFARQEPPLWRQNLASNGATPVSSVVQAPDNATMVVIEVPDGFAIRYEINLNGPLASNALVAGTNSPKLSGENVFQWTNGATISFVDASAV